jgi:hypothetical protein
MREGRVLTRSMKIESRQHELFGVDLGEGFPRVAVVVGAVVSLAWVSLLWLAHVPFSKPTSLLYTLPPFLLMAFGFRPSLAHPERRKRVSEWALAARWVLRGHQPLIALGRRPADRGELMSLKARITHRWAADDARTIVQPWRLSNARMHATVHDSQSGALPRGIRVSARPQLIGLDVAERLAKTSTRRSR